MTANVTVNLLLRVQYQHTLIPCLRTADHPAPTERHSPLLLAARTCRLHSPTPLFVPRSLTFLPFTREHIKAVDRDLYLSCVGECMLMIIMVRCIMTHELPACRKNR